MGIFTRTLKTDIIQFVDSGLTAWSEEDRITKAMWNAIEGAGVHESHRKKASNHMAKGYDDAHFNAPFGSPQNDSLSMEVATLQDFVKGWMTVFGQKAYNVLENGTDDGSPAG